MPFFIIENLKSVCSGQYLSRGGPGALERVADGISTDSRAILPGQVFLALAGDRFDGHEFAAEVARSGAAAVIVQRDIPGAAELPVPVIKVESTRKALLRLAAAYRRTLKETKVIAVCGSNGKSTTVRLIEAVLSRKLRGTASKKSHNNDIGVPLTILSAKPSDQYLICEVGTNHPGEIATLGSVVEPDLAIITSIGREHMEFFGDLSGVAREEAAILPCIRPGGLAVVTADSPELRPLLKPAPSVLTFGLAADASLRLSGFGYRQVEGGGVAAVFQCSDRLEITLGPPGKHNACNALAAVAVARRLAIDDKTIAAALATARGPEMRWQAETVTLPGGDVEVINDAYNANPDSLAVGLTTFGELYGKVAPGRRRVLVLGDMLELGATSDASHAEAGRLIASSGCVDVLITVGQRAQLAADACAAAGGPVAVRVPEVTDATVAALAGHVRPGDVVLLKGSRGMRLERVLKAIKGGAVPPVPAAAVTVTRSSAVNH